MFMTLFYAWMRIGEAAVSTNSSHLLKIGDIQFQGPRKHPSSYTVSFNSYKHSRGQPHKMQIKQSSTNSNCPVQALHGYVVARRHKVGPLFQSQDGSAITRSEFESVLQGALSLAGVKGYIRSHSFRAGAATTAAMMGASEEQIRASGRWKSDAYKCYIRPSVIQSFL